MIDEIRTIVAGDNSLLLECGDGQLLFITSASRLYEIGSGPRDLIDDYAAGRVTETELLGQLGIVDAQARLPVGLSEGPLRALSLNVAQSCNLACRYCYADEGRFGGNAMLMEQETAERAVDMLIDTAKGSGQRLLVGFMGGEPMLNRKLVHHVTRYADMKARAHETDLRFSITTNATMLQDEDIALFRDYPYAVQISIDGGRATTDLARPMRSGRSSFEQVCASIDAFERIGRPLSLSARATVMPGTRDLVGRMSWLISLGFDDIGFSPVLSSPDPLYQYDPEELRHFTRQMIDCGQVAMDHLIAGRAFAFSNLTSALLEIHRGSHRPRSCGAGESYLSVDGQGDVYACHRLVNDKKFLMGSLDDGIDDASRQRHLGSTHVDRQEPCRTCWARYLCGGGCHHEVSRRGRIQCDYIREWLAFCLGAYARLLDARPDLFDRRDLN